VGFELLTVEAVQVEVADAELCMALQATLEPKDITAGFESLTVKVVKLEETESIFCIVVRLI